MSFSLRTVGATLILVAGLLWHPLARSTSYSPIIVFPRCETHLAMTVKEWVRHAADPKVPHEFYCDAQMVEKLGPGVATEVLAMLRGEAPYPQVVAIHGLKHIGPRRQEALPELLKGFRAAATERGVADNLAYLAVPRELKPDNPARPYLHMWIMALEAIGAQAAPALPVLQELAHGRNAQPGASAWRAYLHIADAAGVDTGPAISQLLADPSTDPSRFAILADFLQTYTKPPASFLPALRARLVRDGDYNLLSAFVSTARPADAVRFLIAHHPAVSHRYSWPQSGIDQLAGAGRLDSHLAEVMRDPALRPAAVAAIAAGRADLPLSIGILVDELATPDKAEAAARDLIRTRSRHPAIHAPLIRRLLATRPDNSAARDTYLEAVNAVGAAQHVSLRYLLDSVEYDLARCEADRRAAAAQAACYQSRPAGMLVERRPLPYWAGPQLQRAFQKALGIRFDSAARSLAEAIAGIGNEANATFLYSEMMGGRVGSHAQAIAGKSGPNYPYLKEQVKRDLARAHGLPLLLAEIVLAGSGDSAALAAHRERVMPELMATLSVSRTLRQNPNLVLAIRRIDNLDGITPGVALVLARLAASDDDAVGAAAAYALDSLARDGKLPKPVLDLINEQSKVLPDSQSRARSRLRNLNRTNRAALLAR